MQTVYDLSNLFISTTVARSIDKIVHSVHIKRLCTQCVTIAVHYFEF